MTMLDKKPLILLVDDVSENLKVLGTVFKKEGFSIAIASNGAQGLRIAESQLPDIILLDIQMPEMDGFEVCRRLKSNKITEGIPVLFLTARTDSNDVLKGFEVGGVDYITKPFNFSELLARTRTHVDLKLSKEKLNEALTELKNVVATKDKLFNLIAHDLKAPFSGLLGLSEIIMDEFDELEPAELKNFAELIHTSADEVFKLIENLLNWSRIQTGRIDFVPTYINIQKAFIDTINILKNQAKAKDITVLNLAPDTGQVYADRHMLDVILRNLLSNAIKFTNNFGTVKLFYKPGKDCIILAVEDNGMGMSEDDQKKLFVLDSTHTTKGTAGEKGTGLGLVLCKQMVERHNGVFTLISNTNTGTRFELRFPLHQE